MAWVTLNAGLKLGTWYRFGIKADAGTDTFDRAIYDSEGEHFTASRLTFRNPVDGIAFG